MFLWNKKKKAYPFLFSISSFSHRFVFSGVLVYDHLYVDMKNEDKVLIDVLLENHGAFVESEGGRTGDYAMTIVFFFFQICLYQDFLPSLLLFC